MGAQVAWGGIVEKSDLRLRASNSALDAEDQDQEETPIPGAHNYPPARLFYRNFGIDVYFLFDLSPAMRDVFTFRRPGGTGTILRQGKGGVS